MAGEARERAARRHHTVRNLAVASGLVQYAPSLAVLGQWLPLRSLPMGLCRWSGPPGRANVALTFDDGPHPVATPAILDRLDELEMRATFFPVASLAERQPDLVAEIVRRGHALGTHGYAHDHHLLHGPRWVRRDLDDAERVMAGLGWRTSWYRPAYGQVTAATLAAAKAHGWNTVLWSAWGREWTTGDPEAVVARIARRLRPGSIVLLHDNDLFGPSGMWRVALDALDPLGASLRQRGLHAVTLDELVA